MGITSLRGFHPAKQYTVPHCVMRDAVHRAAKRYNRFLWLTTFIWTMLPPHPLIRACLIQCCRISTKHSATLPLSTAMGSRPRPPSNRRARPSRLLSIVVPMRSFLPPVVLSLIISPSVGRHWRCAKKPAQLDSYQPGRAPCRQQDCGTIGKTLRLPGRMAGDRRNRHGFPGNG